MTHDASERATTARSTPDSERPSTNAMFRAHVIRRPQPWLLICVAATTACGSGSTEPSADAPTDVSFIGELSVPAADTLGGLFHLTTRASTASAGRGSAGLVDLSRVLDWVVAPLWAQTGSGSATGTLTTLGGRTVALAGTHAGGSFNVSGGGYTIAASVGGSGALSGAGTAPGGATASVQALPVPVTAPAPSNPTGTYRGTFTMTTILRSRNVDVAGRPLGSCNYPLRITGDLTMHVSKVGSGDQVEGHLDINWREQSAGGSTCPPVFVHDHTDYHGIDFIGSVTTLNAVRILTAPAGPANAGTITRTQGFTGAVSGSTVVGTVFLSMSFTTPVSDGTHFESFSPIPKITVTLTRS
jgi:hypothetical protein